MPKFARSHALTRVAAWADTLCITWIAAQADTQADVQAVTVTKFGSPGTDMPFLVPDGVTSIHVVAIGGAGGLGAHNPASGGLGAVVSGDVAVKPGQTLFVDVAGNGANANNGIGGSGGLNGGGAGGNSGTATAGKAGGGGGGESGIRITAGAVLTGLIMASGGGGAGGGSQGGTGGSSSVSDGKDGQSGDVGATKNMEPGGAAGPGGTSSGPGAEYIRGTSAAAGPARRAATRFREVAAAGVAPASSAAAVGARRSSRTTTAAAAGRAPARRQAPARAAR
jgi:Glycine rich protein